MYVAHLELGQDKELATSIKVNGIVHEFLASDKTHPISDKIYAMLEETDRLLDNYGHVPDTYLVLYDMEDELKECVLSKHSELLAIAFGLISTKNKTRIRIMKNLRVCENCHSATKVISKIFKREIIARDRSRFHHFKDGACSFNDQWIRLVLTSKWHTLNHNFQKFNAIFKRVKRLGKSGENDLDVMKRARSPYRDENKGTSFSQEYAWEILRCHAKWDAPNPVDLTEGDQVSGVGQAELFSEDAQPRPPSKQLPDKKTKSDTTTSTGRSNSSSQLGNLMTNELCLKWEAEEKAYEVSNEKDRTVMRFEEMKFLAISTNNLSEDDAYWINVQKQ
ncbi:glutathione S-transferase T3-like protein [Tanacetum coccineum]